MENSQESIEPPFFVVQDGDKKVLQLEIEERGIHDVEVLEGMDGGVYVIPSSIEDVSELNTLLKGYDVEYISSLKLIERGEGQEEETDIDEEEREHGVADAFFSDGKFVPYLLANEIMDITEFRTLKDTHEIYRCGKDVWEGDGEEWIAQVCRALLSNREKDHYVNEVISSIRDRNYVDRSTMGWPEGKIHVENGFLDLETREVEPFRPEIFSTVKLPVEYDPRAECPRIMQFLEEVLHPDDVQVILELIGYCLIREYPIHRAFMFVGSGANGKSTLIELIRQFLGEENTASVGLKELTEGRFASADLVGKLANLYADLPDDAMKRTGPFKMATGQDTMRAEKKYRDAFHFRNHAKMIFSANEVPAVMDDTPAFYRRWRIIEFPRTFVGDEADKDLIEKLSTPYELSGLLNQALEGLYRLRRKGEFSLTESIKERKQNYVRSSNPIQAFVMDRVESDWDFFMVYQDLYKEYKGYCREHDLRVVGPSTFGRRFRQFQDLDKRLKTVDGERKNCYVGVKVKDSEFNRRLEEETTYRF